MYKLCQLIKTGPSPMTDPEQITMHHLQAIVLVYLWPLGHTRVLDVLHVCVCVLADWYLVQGYLDPVTGA